MPAATEDPLAAAIFDGRCAIGQIVITAADDYFTLCHRDDRARNDLDEIIDPDNAIEIARHDDAGNYRPLKTAPNLRHGWRLRLANLEELRRAVDHFYPGRLAVFAASKENRLATTTLRETLNRQSGMYRVAAKLSDEEIDETVGRFCRSSDGCLRTILWKRNQSGLIASTKLPLEKFDRAFDQTGRGERAIPLLCQESCNLLVNECRRAVKRTDSSL
jgi:sirohydrochlorin cobaltochelatase